MSKNDFVYIVFECMGEYEPYYPIGVFDADHLQSAFELADESDREARRYNRYNRDYESKVERHYLNRPITDLHIDKMDRKKYYN